MQFFNDRIDNLKSVVLKLRRQLAAAQSEMSSMRGNAAWLRGGLVRDHGGRIELSNSPEGGACVAITLPLEPPGAQT